MANYTVLWIDDHINGTELMTDLDALKELGCDIVPIAEPDKLKIETVLLYDCLIIDLSMPIGTFPPEETEYGRRTGFFLLKKIMKKHPQTRIIVYSMFDAPDVKDYCNKEGIPFWHKDELDSDTFALKIVNFIDDYKNEKNGK